MPLASEMAGKGAIATTQVKQIIVGAELGENAQHTRLKALAGGREGQGKGLVELTVEIEQSRKRGRIHVEIIAYPAVFRITAGMNRENWLKSRKYTPEMMSQARQVLAQHPVIRPEIVPPLRDAVRLVDDDRVPACLQSLDLVEHVRELLQRRDDDPRLLTRERVRELRSPLVGFQLGGESRGGDRFEREVAMQVAATGPTYAAMSDIPSDAMQAATAVFEQEVVGKPAEMRAAILDGKLASYFRDQVLLEQPFIKDEGKTVQQLLNEATQKFGERVEVSRFARLSTR